MLMPALYSFLLTLVFSFIGIVLFRKLSWLDKPHLYGHKRLPVPYGMGVVFFLTFLILSLLFMEASSKLIALLIAGAILTLTCFIDDHKNLPALLRFLIQILCAAIVVFAGVGVPAITNPFGDPFVLDAWQWTFAWGDSTFVFEPLADLIAVIWIVFVINAMNWLDGSPGIVSGISAIACGVLFMLATMNNLHVIDQAELSHMALILGGACVAFLLFDFPQPKMLMGDSGTMFLGLMIAVMAIYSGGKLATAFIVLAFPILDAVWTIIRRLLQGQSPLKGDFQHFHHELMRAGLSMRQVNLLYYMISLIFGLIALYLQSFGKLLAILILFALMTVIRLVIFKRQNTAA